MLSFHETSLGNSRFGLKRGNLPEVLVYLTFYQISSLECKQCLLNVYESRIVWKLTESRELFAITAYSQLYIYIYIFRAQQHADYPVNLGVTCCQDVASPSRCWLSTHERYISVCVYVLNNNV